MFNVHSLCTPTSLRRFWRKVFAHLRYAIPEILIIAASVLVLLGLIERFFFAR